MGGRAGLRRGRRDGQGPKVEQGVRQQQRSEKMTFSLTTQRVWLPGGFGFKKKTKNSFCLFFCETQVFCLNNRIAQAVGLTSLELQLIGEANVDMYSAF